MTKSILLIKKWMPTRCGLFDICIPASKVVHKVTAQIIRFVSRTQIWKCRVQWVSRLNPIPNTVLCNIGSRAARVVKDGP